MRAIIRLMTVPDERRDDAWLRDALQAAIQLELGTIPPYLFASWSVDTNADPDGVAALISGIAHEEMGHMGIACNLLAAVRGRPNILAAVSKYPAVLPLDIHKGLEIGLAHLSKDVLLNAFMAIEEPETLLAADTDFQPSGSLLIGRFYDSVLEAFSSRSEPLETAKQVDLTGFGFSSPIRELKDVKEAIGLIKRQGEGSDGSPLEADGEVAHFYRFGEIFHGAELQAVEGGPFPFAYTGKGVRFPGVLALTVANDQESAEFNRLYVGMLRQLQQAWDLGGDAGVVALAGAVSAMSGMQGEAMVLAALQKGPSFVASDAPVSATDPAGAPALAPPIGPGRFVHVLQILDQAVGGGVFGAHGPFWRGKTRDQFVQLKVFGSQLLVLGSAKDSNLVLALRGQVPFGSDTGAAGATFRRMPAARPPVPDADIDFIASWIDDGCPGDAPAEAVASLSHSTGAQRPDPKVHNAFWRDFDDWAMYHASDETQSAIGVTFGFFPAWQGFAKDATKEGGWTEALVADGVHAAVEMLAVRQKQTLESHYGLPVPLLAVLDGFERFGNDGLPDDPLRPQNPRHNMNGAIMWFIWSSFAEACIRLDVVAEFWRFYMRAILCGLLNDGVYRKRFNVRGFSPVEEDHLKIFEYCQRVPDADLTAELRSRYADSGL
ncbi:ferritin-like protein [uncultured Paludibaculum sp.]|uniref:ferritin-like domain-containing protein n=1 Tax=uncultured Paludibaculum sp. TaxID=1765020 RepID=UPI002AAB836E|nr:ferritin-like protein [uncultured Paludibaculum sp.]